MIMDKMNPDYWKSQLDERWLEVMTIVHRGKDIDRGILEA